MGEAAELMLDGTLCEGCGVYLGGEAHDTALLCADCAVARRGDGRDVWRVGKFFVDAGITPAPAAVPKVPCPTCGRKVKPQGMRDHARDVHGEAPRPA